MEFGATFHPTARTMIRRVPARASYERSLAYAILDEALVCSVGFVVSGEPYVIPMAFARWEDRLVLHGAPASRLLGVLADGGRICVTVTLLDGLVFARSAFHHSMNYRSVVVLGVATELSSPDEKRVALGKLVDHVLGGRSREARPPSPKELASTRVLAMPIEEASIKVRAGGPIDDESDAEIACWSGHLPLALAALPPVPDERYRPNVPAPAELMTYTRFGGNGPPRAP